MTTTAQPLVVGSGELDANELVQLAAIDHLFYCTTFFPQTYKQPSARFHKDAWELLDDRTKDRVALKFFRGGAKTATLRTYTSKRIAYGISRTILFVSNAQEHSKKSLDWLKLQVTGNRLWAGVYGLSKGRKWADHEIIIRHNALGIDIAVLALGIEGQVRGTLVEDSRPDLIVVDDPCCEENMGTPEQREKVAALFFGALEKSLAPATECPDSKMVLLQTPLHQEDLVNLCEKDPHWASRSYSCFDALGKSTWPERFPTEVLQRDKQGYVNRGQLSIWLREMEVRVVSSETAAFKSEWLRYWDVLPEGMVTYLAVDPVPPPSDREIAMGLKKKDFECLGVIGAIGADRYLLDYATNRGHDPGWTVAKFFELAARWNPLQATVEGVAYQRALKWLLEQEMQKRGRFLPVVAVNDRRKKPVRIVQALSGLASAGHFFVHRSHMDFVEQFSSYPSVPHDDILDMVAQGLGAVTLAGSAVEGAGVLPPLEPLPEWRAAP